MSILDIDTATQPRRCHQHPVFCPLVEANVTTSVVCRPASTRPSLLCSSVARRPGPLSTIYTIAQMTHFGEFMIITFYPSVKFLPVTLIYRLYYISLPLVQRASWTRPDDETIYFCS